ncbi:porin family protein [Hymenobacter psychrotolerans]|uniref:Outer membrane protein beta-barrel domain-containing protein n=1 Tax=Hymenobacter psychrotolerans DSM 18569 TaxID=1121959 RepID=A0A1M6S1D4_9BACT|nr:porin family protein [Hymenobacter psychrotolerans]SHK38614.1 Outer membrane protein beta-barrel domain-containing protein [Hymenobacter psychrotolerans DSM 18569]
MKSILLKGLLASALLVAGAGTAQAQVTIGPRLGLNLANIKADIEDAEDIDTKMKAGAQAGITINAQFGNVAFQPSLMFSQKGFKIKESMTETFAGETISIDSEMDAALNYLDIPLNFVYTTGGDNGFQIFAGPYVGIGLGGKVKAKVKGSVSGQSFSNTESTSVKFANEEGDDDKLYLRRINAGLNGGIGYKAGPFQVQAGYALGLTNMLPKNDYDDNSSFKDRTLQFSVNYFFATK